VFTVLALCVSTFALWFRGLAVRIRVFALGVSVLALVFTVLALRVSTLALWFTVFALGFRAFAPVKLPDAVRFGKTSAFQIAVASPILERPTITRKRRDV
jgi:hypothetical protein